MRGVAPGQRFRASGYDRAFAQTRAAERGAADFGHEIADRAHARCASADACKGPRADLWSRLAGVCRSCRFPSDLFANAIGAAMTPASTMQLLALVSDRHARWLSHWRGCPTGRARCPMNRHGLYRVWLFEVMLQQTTVPRSGSLNFEKFTALWPSSRRLPLCPRMMSMAALGVAWLYSLIRGAQNLDESGTRSGPPAARFPATKADCGPKESRTGAN